MRGVFICVEFAEETPAVAGIVALLAAGAAPLAASHKPA